MFRGIDLFSDTATRPSSEMKKAMMAAETGDEQRGEDPTTRALEDKMAETLGFSAALFFPSSTQCNQIAISVHCSVGEQIVASDSAHIFTAEAGAYAAHARAVANMIQSPNGIFAGEQVRSHIQFSHGPHSPPARLLSVENTTNMGGGVPWSRSELDSVLIAAKDLGLRTHLDGSRLFNAAVAGNVSPASLAKGFDTVTICLSKGLGCPFGAVLAFDKKHFSQIRRLKQMFGGALRQSGIVAAAGLYALEHNVDRLADDHANARALFEGLSALKGLEVEAAPATNMVFFRPLQLSPEAFADACAKQQLRFSQVGKNRFRAVTHLDISREDIVKCLSILKNIVG